VPWNNDINFGDPLTGEEKEMVRISYELAKRGAFSYHRLRKEYTGIKVTQYKIGSLKSMMHRVFVKLGVNSLVELMVLIFKDQRKIA
jgi:hypothetical protein